MGGYGDDNGHGGSESTSPKYSIHPTFSDAYYNDITKPEDYYTNTTILNDIIEAFSEFIKKYEQYSYLRIINISKHSNIRINDYRLKSCTLENNDKSR